MKALLFFRFISVRPDAAIAADFAELSLGHLHRFRFFHDVPAAFQAGPSFEPDCGALRTGGESGRVEALATPAMSCILGAPVLAQPPDDLIIR